MLEQYYDGVKKRWNFKSDQQVKTL